MFVRDIYVTLNVKSLKVYRIFLLLFYGKMFDCIEFKITKGL